jgi:N-acetylmuramoyl-L-alanine amidase
MGKSVYLSPSTQEHNIGAGNYGTEEMRMNQVADVTQRELLRHGVTVYRNKPEMTLTQVINNSNAKKPDLHQAIHSNASSGKARGCEVFCYKFGCGLGETLARNVYTELEPLTPTADHGVKQGKDFYGPGKNMAEVANTNAPAALVEIAFHDNPDDAIWIVTHIEIIGIAIAKANLKTLEIPYQPIQNDISKQLAQSLYAKGWITNIDYWVDVLNGKIPANPEYLKILFGRATGTK